MSSMFTQLDYTQPLLRHLLLCLVIKIEDAGGVT
jgi:hypothetical protein